MRTFWLTAAGAFLGTLVARLFLDAGVIWLWLRGHDWAGALFIGPAVIVGATSIIIALSEWVDDRERSRR